MQFNPKLPATSYGAPKDVRKLAVLPRQTFYSAGLLLLLLGLPAAAAQTVLDAIAPPTAATFRATELFQTDPTPWAPQSIYVFPAADSYERLASLQQVVLTDFPLNAGVQIDLELERFYAHGIGARFVLGTEAGDVPVAPPSLATFRGRVLGRPDSWVVVGATPENVYGIVRLGPREEYWIAPPPVELSGMPHAIYERFAAAELFGPVGFRCETPPASPRAAPQPAAPRRGQPRGDGFQWRVLEIAVDGDWELRQRFATPEAALDYMALLAAVISAVYERDMELKIALVYARIWNTPSDPYTQPDLGEQWDEFSDYWNDNMGHVPRNVAHLLSGRDLGGGIARLGALCDSGAYGVDSAIAGAFPYPVQPRDGDNWDILVIAHELGHNAGSPHTHCFSPPIDTCAGEAFDCPNPRSCQVGTIMSYCHLCMGGIANVELRFHARVADEIRDYIEDECPRVGRDPCHVDRLFNGNELGTSSQPYDTVLEGVQYVFPSRVVLVRPGVYPERFFSWSILNRPLRLERWGSSGVVRIGAP